MVPSVDKRSNWNNRTRPPSGPLAVPAGGPLFGNSRCGNCDHKHLRRFPFCPTARQCRGAFALCCRGDLPGCHGVVQLCARRSHASIGCGNDADVGLAQGATALVLVTHSDKFASPKTQSELGAGQARVTHLEPLMRLVIRASQGRAKNAAWSIQQAPLLPLTSPPRPGRAGWGCRPAPVRAGPMAARNRSGTWRWT